jgi:uncharacterized membrane-anchored protein
MTTGEAFADYLGSQANVCCTASTSNIGDMVSKKLGLLDIISRWIGFACSWTEWS